MFKQIKNQIIGEINKVLNKVNEKTSEKIINDLIKADKVFLSGKGRSGLIAEAFAMRLTHLGLDSHVFGEATAPAITKDDFLIAISGSGTTKLTLDEAREARKAKARICAITSGNTNKIAKISDYAVKLKAKTKIRGKSIEPMGSLFEQCALIYLDTLVIIMMGKMGKSEKELKKRHARD